MPAKNTIKTYQVGGFYHIYNRGVNKMDIFSDEKDYGVFLSYLKTYLLPKDVVKLDAILADPQSSSEEKDVAIRGLNLNNFYNRINLLAYCLMPNHYHLLVMQKDTNDIEIFMKSIMTRYTQYFNRRYKRIGPVYQGRYKAVLVETDAQLLHLTRYIHRNLFSLKRTVLFQQPSSYRIYLKKVKQDWINPDIVLQNFAKTGFNSYQSFIENTDLEFEELSSLAITKLTIDSED